MKTVKACLGILIVLSSALYISFIGSDMETTDLDEHERKLLKADFVELKHGPVHYQLQGTEHTNTIVLVHGFSTPSYLWDRNVDALLAAGYRVLRFDLYGRGYSARPDLTYDIDLFVEQLDEITRALGIKQAFHLAGLSMGGPITARFAHQHPERVKSLSLLAPLVNTPESLDLTLIKLPYVGEYLASVVMMPKIENGIVRSAYDASTYPEWHKKMAQHIHYKGYRRALLSSARHLAGKLFTEDYRLLGDTGIPTQLIWGKEDRIINFEQSQILRTTLPELRFHSLEKTGHLPQIEQAESVNTWLIEHLSRVDGSPINR